MGAGSPRPPTQERSTVRPAPRSRPRSRPEVALEGELGPDGLALPVDVDAILTSLHGFLEQELDHLTPDAPRARATLLHELGNLEELVLQDPARALSRNREAHSADPGFLPALRGVQRHHAKRAAWSDLLEALRLEVKLTSTEEARAALLERQAEVLAHRLSDTDGAIEALRAAVSLAPHSRRALELLRGIYARLGRWEDLLGVLQQLGGVTSDPVARSRLTVEMAEVAEYRLDQSGRAEELYAYALQLDTGNEKALVALRRLYQAHGRWKELTALLATEAGREHEPDEMFADLYWAARITELHLHDESRAASLLETASALRPSDPLPLVPLTEIYGRIGLYEEQAAALGRQLRMARDAAERASICHRLGRVCDDWLGRADRAVEAYRQALKQQPGHDPSLRALAQLYLRLQQWEDLVELQLLRAERNRDPLLRSATYLQAAEICERRLPDSPQNQRKAIDLYQRAWRLRQGASDAFRALDRIYRRTEQWEALADLYQRKAEQSKDPALAVSLWRGAAWICERRLDDRERALNLYERIRQQKIEDREALFQLARLYEELGRMSELRRTLEEWAELTEDEQEENELQRRIGELLEGPLRQTEQAIERYRKILEQHPDDRATRERLKAIFERSGRWNDLVEVARGELEVCDEPLEQAALQLQLGQIAENKLGDLAQAQEDYEAALGADANNTPALIALMDLLRRQADWARLVKLLMSHAEGLRDAGRAAVLLCQAAELCETRLDDAAEAERYYNQALSLDPACSPARHGLERLYQAAGDRAALESHYLREAEGAANPVLRLRAYLRLGTLFDGPGDDPESAIKAYESALKVVSDHPDALHALTALCRRMARWERLAELMARVAATADDREVAIAALQEWGSTVETFLAEKWDAAPIFERLLEANPHDLHALDALERLAFERLDFAALLPLTLRQIEAGGDGEQLASLSLRAAVLMLIGGRDQEAVDVLRRGLTAAPTYLPAVRLLRRLDEKLEHWREAAQLLQLEGELAARPETAAAAMLRAGNIWLERFNEVEAARASFARVFDADPRNASAFGRLAEVLSSGGQWKELVTLYQRRMAAVDPTARTTLQLELARLHRHRLDSPQAAVQVLEELLEAVPEDLAGLSEMADLCVDLERWREAEQILERLADAATDPDQSRDAQVRRATILEEQLGEEETALAVLRELLQERPGDREALGRCMRIYQRRADWERTVEVLSELAREGSPLDRINGLVDLAEIYSRTLGEPNSADKVLRSAASLCVESGQGIERVSDYFERRGDFDGLVDLLGGALQGLPPEGATPGAVPVRLARAKLLAGRLLRPDEAEREIRQALAADPQSAEARLELANLHVWGDNLADATTEYTRVLEAEPFGIEALRGLYRVYERRGDLDRTAGVAQAICAVGEPEEVERRLAQQAEVAIEPALASAVATPLGIEALWQLLAHPGEPEGGRELLLIIGDHLPQILGPELEERPEGAGVMPLDDTDPLVSRCRLIGQLLGVTSEFTCGLAQRWPGFVSVLPGSPPRVVLDDRFARRAAAARLRFVIARAMTRLLTRSFYLSALKPRTVELLLAALVEPFERGFGDYLPDKLQVEELARGIARAVPRKVRRLLEEPARRYAAGRPVSPTAWEAAARCTADRAGLLLAGDVAAGLYVLSAEKADEAERAELLRFAIGPHLYEARRRLGIAIEG